MTEMMHQVSESMTIGELRLECEKQIQAGGYPEKDKQVSVVSVRLRQDKKHILEPFTLMAHKPNYAYPVGTGSSGFVGFNDALALS